MLNHKSYYLYPTLGAVHLAQPYLRLDPGTCGHIRIDNMCMHLFRN